MISKILALLLICFLIYIFFFKKKRVSKSDEQNFVECDQCGIFVDINDTIVSRGKYICKECFNANHRK